jgi:hypothetical protein
MDDKKSTGKAETRARTTTPHYNASGLKAPRYNVKGIGKMGWSLGGLKGMTVSPEASRGKSERAIQKSIGGALTGMNSNKNKLEKS